MIEEDLIVRQPLAEWLHKDIDGMHEENQPDEEMNILDALDNIQEEAKGSRLSENFWNVCNDSIEYLCRRLGLNKKQVVLISIMSEIGESVSWRHIGDFLGISRLKTMSFTSDLEDLRNKRWIYQCAARERGGMFQGFKLVFGVINAFRHDKVFVPEKIEGLSLQSFVDKLTKYVYKEGRDRNIDLEENHRWMLQLTEANRQIPLCDAVMNLNSDYTRIIMLLQVADYARFAKKENEGIVINEVESWFEDGYELDTVTKELQDGTNELFERGWFEHGCQDGMIDTEHYMLTDKAKEELLDGFKPRNNEERRLHIVNRDLLKSNDIKAKNLFFNCEEQRQIDRLKTLMSIQGLKEVQNRLAECGLRRGIACLFYGAPGTGKTESVLQIARETGRDIMRIDIAGLRDKWVGESEKNIKGVFDRYRRLCKSSEKTPILFFNEADAIINKRLESADSSVEKMDNAMQNIILQELENLDGIVIATTNLTGCIDKAFDRRFLFKVEFSKPGIEAKKSIWHSMIPEMSDNDCLELAAGFDFSGGQIENISRKCKIEYVVSGKTPSMQLVKEFCKEEYLNRSSMKRIGF
ncbi:MAG: ATP-binding protein [Muribaculaceae bacterium]|nr:ATP-binding protein [Muribaculaceae bacterium]